MLVSALPIKQLVFPIFSFLTSGSVHFSSGLTYQYSQVKRKTKCSKQNKGGGYRGSFDCRV